MSSLSAAVDPSLAVPSPSARSAFAVPNVGRNTTLVIGALCAGLYLAVGWYLTFDLHFFIGDTLARLANASYVVYSRQPHLAAIGFAWLPLPSVLELPFIVLLRPFGMELYAGAVVTSLTSALNVLLVRRILHQIGVAGWPCAVLVAVYALNPFIVMYAADGMSEALLLTALLLTTSFLMSWERTAAPGPLLAAGLVCGAAWGVRFESLGLVASGSALIVWVWCTRFRDNPDRLEGELLAFLCPFALSVGLWLLASWLMTGTPFYFISGSGNNAADSLLDLKRSGAAVVGLYHHPLLTLEYIAVRCLWYMPAFAPLLLLGGAYYAGKRHWTALFPALVPAPILLMHVYLLYSLQSYGELRYYCYILPAGIFAAAITLTTLSPGKTRRAALYRRWATGVVLFAAALSVPSTFAAMANPAVGRQERPVIDLILGRSTPQTRLGTWGDERRMASYIDSLHLPSGSVLLDTTNGFPMFLLSSHPQQYIVPSDADFQSTLAQLLYFRGYVLVSRSATHASILIRAAYPSLLTTGTSWTRPVHSQGPWMLYRILTR